MKEALPAAGLKIVQWQSHLGLWLVQYVVRTKEDIMNLFRCFKLQLLEGILDTCLSSLLSVFASIVAFSVFFEGEVPFPTSRPCSLSPFFIWVFAEILLLQKGLS